MMIIHLLVARGLMGKLTPNNKKCEFMGFYSTFLYLGVSAISGANSIAGYIPGLPAQVLLLFVFLWMLPAYPLFFILYKSLKRNNKL